MKKKYMIIISARISNMPGDFPSGENLQVSEEVAIYARDFLELCQILGQVHQLAERVRHEQQQI